MNAGISFGSGGMLVIKAAQIKVAGVKSAGLDKGFLKFALDQ